MWTGRQSSTVRLIMEELAAHGISGGPYHLPDFEETPEGLRERLDALFRVTPPTAIFATYPGWMFGVLSYLAARGLKVPEDVSVICGNDASGFAWTQPRVAHYQHDDERMARRMVKWVDHWAQGRQGQQAGVRARAPDRGRIDRAGEGVKAGSRSGCADLEADEAVAGGAFGNHGADAL